MFPDCHTVTIPAILVHRMVHERSADPSPATGNHHHIHREGRELMTANYVYGQPTSRAPDDAASVMRQVVHTQVETYQPPTIPAYATPARGRFGTTGWLLVQDASRRTRVVVGNVVLTLAGITASVFLIALAILGVRLWGWLA